MNGTYSNATESDVYYMPLDATELIIISLTKFAFVPISCLGFVLNILSVIVWSSREVWSTTAMYMVSLAVYDALYLAMQFVYLLPSVLGYSYINRHPWAIIVGFFSLIYPRAARFSPRLPLLLTEPSESHALYV